MASFACKRVCIVHGYLGRSANHWQKWLADECEKQGIEAVYPKLPYSSNPKLTAWLSRLHEIIGAVDQNTAFVGHSLGCQTVLQFMRTLGPSVQVGPVILVSPSTPHRIKRQGFPVPNEFFAGLTSEVIRECALRALSYHVVYSDNDVFVDPIIIRALIRRIHLASVLTHVLPNAGHITPPLFERLPLALELLQAGN